MPDKNQQAAPQDEMVDATDADGNPVKVAKTRPEETVPSVRTQRGAIFSRGEQDRLANENLKTQQEGPSAGASGTASTQDASTTTFPPTTTGAAARGGATRSSTTRPRGQE
jgi:hypothetical protein